MISRDNTFLIVEMIAKLSGSLDWLRPMGIPTSNNPIGAILSNLN
jgi:hypothetical protein